MEHRQIIDWAIEATQELLQKQGNIQETDIRDRIIEKFNIKRQRDYTSDKEHENRSDLIVYHKGKPYLIYEFKKYFKPIRKSEIVEIQKDFGKLHKAHQSHSSCKTYYVLVSTSSYIEDAKIEGMENFMNLSVGLNKIFKLDYMGKMIYLYNRKRAIQPDFCVLSWEIK